MISYSGWEREGAQVIRDVAESGVPFTRILDLLSAIHLMDAERGVWLTDEARSACTVELVRRAAKVGAQVTAMNKRNGTVARSYRREMSLNSRLAAGRMLDVGLGAFARALAKRASAHIEQTKAVREGYHAVLAAIEAAA
jgi:hypothetical protein